MPSDSDLPYGCEETRHGIHTHDGDDSVPLKDALLVFDCYDSPTSETSANQEQEHSVNSIATSSDQVESKALPITLSTGITKNGCSTSEITAATCMQVLSTSYLGTSTIGNSKLKTKYQDCEISSDGTSEENCIVLSMDDRKCFAKLCKGFSSPKGTCDSLIVPCSLVLSVDKTNCTSSSDNHSGCAKQMTFESELSSSLRLSMDSGPLSSPLVSDSDVPEVDIQVGKY